MPMARASLVPKLTGASAGSRARSQRTRELSWMLRWKLSERGWEEEEEVAGAGGRKWVGETEWVVHDGSAVVRGAPFMRATASERDWESRRSWADRNCGGGTSGVEGDGVADGYEYERVRESRSMDWVRRVCRVVNGARWIGWSGLMVRIWWGRVRRRRWMVWCCECELEGGHRDGEKNTPP